MYSRGRGSIFQTALLTAAILLVQRLDAGTRFEVVPMFGPDRVSHARVCFSRALDGARQTVLDRLISGPDAKCLPTDKILNLPSGIWHFYVVNDDPFLVSTHPTELVRPTASSDYEEVSRMYSELLPAATVRLAAAARTLDSSETLALYITHVGSEISAPALVPVSAETFDMPVPAGAAVVPLVLRGGEIVAVGDQLTLDVGGVAEATFPARAAATVVIPYVLPTATEVSDVPIIRAWHHRSNHAFAEYTPGKADWRGLIFLFDVPPGRLEVTVDATKFTASRVAVDVPAGAPNRVLVAADMIISASIHSPITRSDH
jgi:hypothetical protein